MDTVVFLEERQDLLAARGGVAADNMDQLLVRKHCTRQLGIAIVAAAGIVDHGLKHKGEG